MWSEYGGETDNTRGMETIIQGGAEETRVFHIRITSFIFNIKKF